MQPEKHSGIFQAISREGLMKNIFAGFPVCFFLLGGPRWSSGKRMPVWH
jgi:hypothetical protein